MHFLGSVIKHILRSVFSIIVFLLLVGMAKMDWNVGEYISFLNTNDWSQFHRSQTATWTDPFWPQATTGDIADIFPADVVDVQSSGLDVYDPAFEQDLNQFTDPSATGQEDFGFTAEGQVTPEGQTSSGIVATDQLLNAIQQRVNK